VKKRILFLCIGNSCRSQMAQGFARRYGSDVLDCESAGIAPASIVQPLTKKVMEEKNINIDDQYPKDVETVNLREYDLVINMSGTSVPTRLTLNERAWTVEDPIGRPEEVYLKVRDEIEMLVMQLILEFRREERKQENPVHRRRRIVTGTGPGK